MRRRSGSCLGVLASLVTAALMVTACDTTDDQLVLETEAPDQAPTMIATPAVTNSITFAAIADARVEQAARNTSFGADPLLGAASSPRVESLVKFQLADLVGTVQQATLQLYVVNPSADGPTAYRTSTAWSETVTWTTRPRRGTMLADSARVDSGTWVSFDVTTAIGGDGVYAFALASKSSDGATFSSREGAHPPLLVVTTTGGSATAPDAAPADSPDAAPADSPDAAPAGSPDAAPADSPDAAPAGSPDAAPPPDGQVASVTVHLVPRVTGTQRINFAVPLAQGVLTDAARVRVLRGTTELPAARRGLARYADGSLRSVQLQADVTLSGEADLTIRLGDTPTAGTIALVPVETTLEPSDGAAGPRVWALLPAGWLAASGVTGPTVPAAEVAGTALDAWGGVCDYARWNTDVFLDVASTTGNWLFDRPTAFYRGYARRGDLTTLTSAYREASIYRNGITGTGHDTRIGVPGASGDGKYHYTQGLAIHYLLTGDDRFRESAEDVATRAADLWPSPGYAGGADFWTERSAGFALLAYVWAMIVTDDEVATFRALADQAVTAYLSIQATYPAGYTDPAARCFAHTAEAAGESFGTWGCSPWMSAILADALDVYATERGGQQAAEARAAIVKLGRSLARDGRDGTGRPYYWMGEGATADVVDSYDEHWGESAYVVAMAWYHAGRSDQTLRTAADSLVAGLKARGSAGQLRSFNWQCRSAVATPFYLK